MGAEAWYRNPQNYVRELIEAAEFKFIFDYGWTRSRNLDPVKWAAGQFGTSPFRMIVAGDQGGAEYGSGDVNPRAVYPVWQYGENEGILEGLMESNVGNSREACDDESVDILSRPVFGQEHRVIVMNFPDTQSGPGRKVMTLCRELTEEYPDAILHIHGLSTFAAACRMGLKAFDFDPRTPAQHGTIFMPTGRLVRQSEPLAPFKEWLGVMNFKPVDMREPRNRCIMNIKSARWAADNFHKDLRLKMRAPGGRTGMRTALDTTTPDAEYDPIEDNRIKFKTGINPKPGDKFECDSCSLAMGCKFYREGSVCSVPGSDASELANHFKSRDSNVILDGLSELMVIGVDRLEKARIEEEDFGTNAETTKILGQLFDQGRKLAQLRDPSLRSTAAVQVNVGTGKAVGPAQDGQGQLTKADVARAIGDAVKQLELQGIPREQQTKEMVADVLRVAAGRPAALGGNQGPQDAVPLSEVSPGVYGQSEPDDSPFND